VQSHADAQMALARRAADRVRASDFLAVDRCAHADVLTRREAEGIAQLVRHIERDADGFTAFRPQLANS
jgi:hypothetical protein